MLGLFQQDGPHAAVGHVSGGDLLLGREDEDVKMRCGATLVASSKAEKKCRRGRKPLQRLSDWHRVQEGSKRDRFVR